MASLPAASLARPRRTLLFAVALVAAAVPGILRLELRTDGHALVPPDSPAVRFDAEVRQHFELRDPIVVSVESSRPEGIFELGVLRRVRELSERLAGLEGIEAGQVMSLATETRNRVYPGSLHFRPFLDPLPDTEELMAQLRSDVDEITVLTGTLVSADRRATAILVGVPASDGAEPGPGIDRIELYRRIEAEAEQFAGDGLAISVVGAPVAEALLGFHILEDLVLLLPLSITIIALVLWLGCRRSWGVLLGLLEIGACLGFTFGLMGWLGVPVYLPTAVLPVILVTIGLADEIHIFWCHQRELAMPGARPTAAIRATMKKMSRPVVFTSLTTSVGFLSFLASPLVAVRAFGAFAAVGILFCMVWSLTSIPASLALLPARWLRRPVPAAAKPGWTQRILRPLLARWGTVLGVIATTALVAGIGVRYVYVQDSWIDGFAPDSRFRRDMDRFNASFHGSHLLLAHLTFEPPEEEIPEDPFGLRGPLLSPPALAAVGELEESIAGLPGVGGVLGLRQHFSAIENVWRARVDEQGLMEHPRGIAKLVKRFEFGRGLQRRRQVVDDELRRTVITVFLKNANYRDTAALTQEIRRLASRHLAPVHGRLELAGDVAVSQTMISAIVETQVFSLLLALAGALLTVWLLYRSFTTALLALLPVSLAVLMTFGAIGWLGIPLGVATSMFCAITLGIGVDYAIHLLESHRRAMAGGDREPTLTAVAETSPAIIADTLAISLGFGLLGFSQVPANARLGLLVAVALGASSVLTLTGLAALLSLTPARPQTGESRS